jgi:deferrochelatase/peroxidase EfeB
MQKSGKDGISATRRGVLRGMGAGLAGGAVLAESRIALAAEPQVADAPIGDARLEQSYSFYGVHQQGVLTPRPEAGMVAAFDVLASDRAGLERLLRLLTERAAFLMKGGPVEELDPKFPPPDSGILGPVVSPNGLTLTVSLGESLFDERFGLKTLRPAHLERMTGFPNDALEAPLCHGDLVIQFCAHGADTNIHALRDIVKHTPDLLLLRWKQEGTVPPTPAPRDMPPESARNLLGFRDGTANPDTNDKGLMDKIVWTGAGNGEPAWTAGGSYQVVRIIRNFVERWDRTPLQEQEAIFGRRKASGAPFTGHTEHDIPDYSKDPKGKVTPLDAHIRLANPRTPETQKNLILRRPFNYSNGVTKSGQLEMGLLFIVYQADLKAGFLAVQERLNHEPLEEYIKPIGGGYFFVLPGARSADDYLGRALIEAAAKL